MDEEKPFLEENTPQPKGSLKHVPIDLDKLKISEELWPEGQLIKDELRRLSVLLQSYSTNTKATLKFAI